MKAILPALLDSKTFNINPWIKVYKVRGTQGIFEMTSSANWADDGALRFKADEVEAMAKFLTVLAQEVRESGGEVEQSESVGGQKKTK